MARAKKGDRVITTRGIRNRQAPRANGGGAEVVDIAAGEDFVAAAGSLSGNVVVRATTSDRIDVYPTLWHGEWRLA